MTSRHHLLIRALARCTFSPGSSVKRFVRWASEQPADAELSEKAAAFLDRLAHSYRRQLGRCMRPGCEVCK